MNTTTNKTTPDLTTARLLDRATARPWRVADQSLGGNAAVFPAAAVAPCIADCNAVWDTAEAEANAELIVRAVNSFEAMRNEIQVAIAAIPEIQSRGDYFAQGIVAQLKKALALSEGGV